MCYAAGWETGIHQFRCRFNEPEERASRRSIVLDEAARALLPYSCCLIPAALFLTHNKAARPSPQRRGEARDQTANPVANGHAAPPPVASRTWPASCRVSGQLRRADREMLPLP